jgi:sporulation protein YlmC with PRC-barrel domain
MLDIDPARPPEHRLEIRPGSSILSRTEEVGKVDRVVVDPDTREIVGLIVRRGILLSHDVLIPIETITEATPNGLRTRLTVEELNALPVIDESRPIHQASSARGEAVPTQSASERAFDRGRLRAARSGQARSSMSGRPLRAGQLVKATDGDVGRLDLLLIEPLTHRVEALVVRQGRFLARDTVIPARWIRDIHRDWILLDVPRARLAELPEYRPDDEIAIDVLDRLWYDSPDLRPADLQYVEVHVRDGIVELTGHTHTEATRARIVEVVRTVRGVREVHDYLDTFESLAAAVREASGRRPPSQVIAAEPAAVASR